MQVLNSKGLANHTGPEPCAQTSNRLGEALAGERAGRVWSRENKDNSGAPTVSEKPEGHTTVIVSREITRGSARSETPYRHGNALRGNRESLGLPLSSLERGAASESPRPHPDDERTQAVGRLPSTDEVPEQAGLVSRGGGDGGKATGQGEGATGLHPPDSEPDTRYVNRSGAPTMGGCIVISSLSKARAGCGNAARPDL